MEREREEESGSIGELDPATSVQQSSLSSFAIRGNDASVDRMGTSIPTCRNLMPTSIVYLSSVEYRSSSTIDTIFAIHYAKSSYWRCNFEKRSSRSSRRACFDHGTTLKANEPGTSLFGATSFIHSVQLYIIPGCEE